MQLVEQNKINLEESINNFLPAQYRSDNWDRVTVHHLLSHTSGIEEYAGVRDYYEAKKGYLQGQIGNPDGDDIPNKKIYDPQIE